MTTLLAKIGLPGLFFLVCFVYPIPHTIALRNLLLVTLLGIGLFHLARHPRRLDTIDWRIFRTPAALLAALTLWLLLQSTLISPRSAEALEMFRGDWLIALTVSLAAMLATLTTHPPRPDRILLALALALLAHLALLLGYQIAGWLSTGYFPWHRTPFAEKDYHSMLVTTLAVLSLGDLLFRAVTGRRWFPCNGYWIAATLVLCTTASLTLWARNATLIIAAELVACCMIFIVLASKSGFKKATFVITLVALLGAGGWLSFSSDSRWSGFQDAARVAFDTENNLAWLDSEKYPRPLTTSGNPVEESAYLRLAWAKVGVEQIAHYPLGLGYGHKAFGWAVERSYRVATGIESSHSGLIDFTLANGIPGLVLWLALSSSLVMAGWRGFRQYGSPAGLALALSVVAYLVRCLLDGHLSGFRLEMYALFVGVLIMQQLQESARCD
ncbi:O-antigen ligase family protein [uncultured Propionivibrio sp.]|uniref:O-antigen ligase family protein n=1 Tax=uncultured Propionivibrio sp. TaxID=426737 RepID=UPI0029BFC757|nr:O-antigen ligase family protein [uncultured Propionivibrio sp.]